MTESPLRTGMIKFGRPEVRHRSAVSPGQHGRMYR